jgi:hypothetical protein
VLWFTRKKIPAFSVVIATYNWSAALKVALASVRAQTFQDFEVLVVGDACTDDSETVVASFKDKRFRWCNLPVNCGSQWGPNNHGLSLARGKYVAYLGHDDVWWPTHLALAYEAFESHGADVVAAATLLYGPTASGIYAVTGFFPNDEFQSRYFFPPSSMAHRLAISQQIGGWRGPEYAHIAVDHDFLVRCFQLGAKIVPTGQFTTFKFPAAWRRDAYKLKDASDQKRFLKHMLQEGETFRLQELSVALRAAVEEKLQKIEFIATDEIRASRNTATAQQFKGSHEALHLPKLEWVRGCVRIQPDQSYAGYEWYAVEQHATHGAFRWSGPSCQSSITIRIPFEDTLEVRIQVIHWLKESSLKTVRLHVNGQEVATHQKPDLSGTVLLIGRIEPQKMGGIHNNVICLTLIVDKTYRPSDLHDSLDRRWLGLAIGWVELEKIHFD